MIPNVSVIIPTYNVEKYLEECLNSVVNQTLSNIEIICINDGSTDKTAEILKEYSKKDNRIKIINQKNHGPGYARNKGLDLAKGEYILFVDSDDWIDLNTCKELYNISKEQDLDILLYQTESFDETKNRFFQEDYYQNNLLPKEFYDTVFNNEDIADYVFSLNVTPYGKLYKRSIINRYRIRFPEDIYFEDNPFYWEVMLSSKRISIVNKFYSLRRRRMNSITSNIDDKFLDVVPISNLILDVFEKYGYAEFYKYKLINFKINYIKQWFNLIEEKYKESFRDLTKKDFLKIELDSNKKEEYLKIFTVENKEFYNNILNSCDMESFNSLNKYSELIRKYSNIKKEVEQKQLELNEEKNQFQTFCTKNRQKIKEKNHEIKDKYTQLSDDENKFKELKSKFIVEQKNLKLKENSLKEIETDLLLKKTFLEEKEISLVDRESFIEEKERSLKSTKEDITLKQKVLNKQKNDLINEKKDLKFKEEILAIKQRSTENKIDLINENNKTFNIERKEFIEKKNIIDQQLKKNEFVLSQKQKKFNEEKEHFNKIQKEKDKQIQIMENNLKERQNELNEMLDMLKKNMNQYENTTKSPLKKLFNKNNFNPLISIIIPVFNAEEYLEDCLDSIIGQTLKNIEIICINDGSTDNSLDILHKYENKDKRIKLINQKNQGQGCARNKALNIAKGEYIMFVDSDDWIDLKTCQKLYEKVKLKDLDILMFLIKNYSEEKQYYEDEYYNLLCLNDYEDKIFNYKQLGDLLFKISISPCQKIYRRSLLENIRFPENIFFEDNPFYWECMLSAKKISLIKEHFYLRRRHDSSTTASYHQNYFDVIRIDKIVWDVFKKYNLDQELPQSVSNHIIVYVKQWYNFIAEIFKEDYWKIMYNFFKKLSDEPKINEMIMLNATEINKQFYLNVLKSNSSYELEYLEKTWIYY